MVADDTDLALNFCAGIKDGGTALTDSLSRLEDCLLPACLGGASGFAEVPQLCYSVHKSEKHNKPKWQSWALREHTGNCYYLEYNLKT